MKHKKSTNNIVVSSKKINAKKTNSAKPTHLKTSITKKQENISIVFERSVTKSATVALRKMSRINLEEKYAAYLKK